MTEQDLLQQILAANKRFLAGNPHPPATEGKPFAVVACIDSRLTGLLEPALGLPRHRAVVIRTAGNQITERCRDAVRSIATALYVKKAEEIVIVAHTDCDLARFSAAQAAENFRSAGIRREAFGNEDLRSWFGAFSSIRDNLLGSIAYLRNSGIVPRTMKIHGLLLDSERGGIEVVVDGNTTPDVPLPQAPAPEAEKPVAAEAGEPDEAAPAPRAAQGPPPPLPREQAPRKGPIIVGQPQAPAAPAPEPVGSLLEAALILRDFFYRERQSQQVRQVASSLKTIWNKEKNPAQIFAEIEKTARSYQTKYPRIPGALDYLDQAIRNGSADRIGFAEILKRIFD